ncbi:esterase-like activity of phytase family protein [Thalassococcus sp. BH17M4-6]|uniref:esterase-like activity of phytase family protein n=1 Tax=Thalassococcus sp. BH17M4-6 TaxID=3413148 RepID=UPI003BDD2596
MRRRSGRAVGAALALGLAVLAAAPATADIARLQSSALVSSVDPRLGGLSGLELSDDGQRFVAISDRGLIVRGRIVRSGGRITGLEHSGLRPLRDPKGRPVQGPAADAEGLALRDDGRIYVSFEGRHRIWRYDRPDVAARLPHADGFADLQSNSGLEALAIDARGWLYTLPERSGALTRAFPVWRYRQSGWDQPFEVPRRGGFLPVGADIGPDGRFYLLERSFGGLGFRTRVRRFNLSATTLDREVTLLETPLGRHGNLEGLSVWRDDRGHICLTMIADDNFNPLQQTEIVEYSVTE